MVALPLGNLEQPFDVLWIGLLHLGNQPISPALSCKKFRKEEHVKIHTKKGNTSSVNLKTNLGTKGTD